MDRLEIDDLRIVENIGILFESEIILAGAGRNAIFTANVLKGSGLTFLGFCDHNEWLQGSLIGDTGLSCSSFEDMADRYHKGGRVRFLLTSHFDEMLVQLTQLGVEVQDINSYWAVLFSVWLNINNPVFSSGYRLQFWQKYQNWTVLEQARYMQIHATDNYIRSWRRMIMECPVFVYQFGKTGSSSVYRGIEECQIPVEQSHALAYEKSFMGGEMRNLYHLFLQSLKRQEKVRIINLVREPIARDISNLFELLDVPFIKMFGHMTNKLTDSICDILTNRVVSDLSELKQMSVADIHYQYKLRGKNGDIFQWYEQEMREVFDIDILDGEFEREKGMGIIRQGNIEVLILTLEKLAENETTIGEFVGNSRFRLCNVNQAKDKPYKYLYRNITDRIQLPEEYLRRYYFHHPYMDYFYTPKMQQEFYQKWQSRGGDV